MKSQALRWLKIIVAVYAAYLALVLLIATPLLNVVAPKIYRQQTGAELKLEKIIWLNPFTLKASIPQASSVNADGSPFWAFDSIDVDFSLASLWRRHLVLDALALRGIALHIEQTEPGRYNFSGILDYRAQHFPAAPAEPANAAQEEPSAIAIGALAISARELAYRAPHAAEPLSANVSELSLTLKNFTTTSISADAVAVLSPRADAVALSARTLGVEVQRASAPFRTALRDIRIESPTLAVDQPSVYTLSARDASEGSVTISGEVAVAQGHTQGSAQLRSLSLLPAWQYAADKLAFELQGALLDGDLHYALNWKAAAATAAPALHYRLERSMLALRGVRMLARSDNDTHLGFASLQLSDIDVDSATPRARIGKLAVEQLDLAGWNRDARVSLADMFAMPASDEPSATPSWQLQVDAVALNGAVRWHASQIDHLPLTLSPLAIELNNLRWPETEPMQLKAAATLNTTAQLALSGALVPSTQSGELLAEVQKLPLAWGDLFLREQMRATLTSGELSARASIKLDNAQPVAVHSDGAIEGFELQQLAAQNSASPADKRRLALWKKLAWQQLTLNPATQRIGIRQIVITQPWVQFRINADGTNNFQQLMGTAEPAATAQKSAPAQRRAAAPESRAPEWQLAVGNIHVDRANIDFRDASLNSAFRTNITELSGDIANLDSSGKKAARVALKGTIDGYAPVALTGTVNPFAAQPALNVTLDMTNIDLAMLTPYSGTYAGYQIDSGRLTVQMAYTLEKNRIKGANHIVVNQMQLGKQVSGPKVMDLPLRMAIYLLTDANGVMDLGVDVTGNVDDPDFSVGSIIWKAFRNLIVKTATSPFRALGRLVGSQRDDLDRIEFEPGSAQLAAGESEKLHTIQRALEKKQALTLNLAGHVSPTRDLEALRDNTLSKQLIEQGGITSADIQQQSKSWQREVVKLFKKRFPDENTERWQVMQMNDAMRDNIELTPAALQELAAQRALAIKQTLVADLGLAADRAFVKPIDLGADQEPGAFVTMAVE